MAVLVEFRIFFDAVLCCLVARAGADARNAMRVTLVRSLWRARATTGEACVDRGWPAICFFECWTVIGPQLVQLCRSFT